MHPTTEVKKKKKGKDNSVHQNISAKDICFINC